MQLTTSQNLPSNANLAMHCSKLAHTANALHVVYDVVISRHCRCNCPDFPRSHLCKHILFVLLRVLAQRPDCPLLWQRALTESEVCRLHVQSHLYRQGRRFSRCSCMHGCANPCVSKRVMCPMHLLGGTHSCACTSTSRRAWYACMGRRDGPPLIVSGLQGPLPNALVPKC